MGGLERARRALRRSAGRAAPAAPPAETDHPTVRLLFDAAHYRRQGGAGGGDPLGDYLAAGWRRGLDPHPLFSTAYYLDEHPDVARAGICPLLHYARHGAREDRRAHPLFDPHYYRDRYDDVGAPWIDPLVHFVVHGGREARDPNPWFDSAFYLAANPDVAAAGTNPLVHYSTSGWRAGRNPHPDFDVAFYTASTPELAGREPLAHFLHIGRWAGREPSADHALRPLLRRGDVPPTTRRLVIVTEDGRRPDRAALLAGCPTIVVTSPVEFEPGPADDVYAPDDPGTGLCAVQLLNVATCLAHQCYDFLVVSAERAGGSTVAAASPSNAVVVSGDGYRRRRVGRPLRAGSIGRLVRLPRSTPLARPAIAVDDLGLGPLIRFGDELVVVGHDPVATPNVARRRPPGPLLSAAELPERWLQLDELGPPDLHEAMRRSISG